jgi:hypothetical protein
MIAFLDESLRRPPDGLYVVAAVVVMSEPESVRRVAQVPVSPTRPRRRFHWRDEEDRERFGMLDRMNELGLLVLGYVRRPITVGGQERARVLCLNRLLWDLQHNGVTDLVIESRREVSDQRDRSAIIHAQQAGIASPDLHYRHMQPTLEPLLWLADAAAGAIAASVAGENDSYISRLPGCEIVEVEP